MRISEKDFEDWVVENIGHVLGDDRAVVVGRQMPCPNGGIMDVVATIPDPVITEVVVLELKGEEADEAAVVQLMRYMGAMDFVLGFAKAGEFLETKAFLTGRVVAPALTSGAGLMIRAAKDNVGFVRLRVGITAERWSDVVVRYDPDVLGAVVFKIFSALQDAPQSQPLPGVIPLPQPGRGAAS